MTSMRRRYVASTSLRRHVPAGNLAPPWPPQYSKPSYAYELHRRLQCSVPKRIHVHVWKEKRCLSYRPHAYIRCIVIGLADGHQFPPCYFEGGRVVRWCWVNFQCRGVLLIWTMVGQEPTVLAVGAGGGSFGQVFFHLSFLFRPEND